MARIISSSAIDLTKRLAGKVALITASTEGIGLAIAKRVVQEGGSVSISSRKLPGVERALAELRALAPDAPARVFGRTCPVLDKGQRETTVKETLDKFGKIDIFVSNAAANPTMSTLLETEEKVWEKILHTNVTASLLFAQLVAPHIVKAGGGSILFVSSIAGFRPFPGLAAYGVSKAALLQMTKVLANELAADKVRVNAIAPGVIETKFSKALTDTSEFSERVRSDIPLHRFGSVDEVASVATFLVSDDASYITGETIAITGGIHTRL